MNRYSPSDYTHAYEQSVDAHPEDYSWSDWCRYPDYDFGGAEGSKFIYVPMDDPRKQIFGRQRYTPLSRPNASLFLEFAAWAEEEGMDLKPLETEANKQAAWSWAEIFGVLGLDDSLHGRFTIMSGVGEVTGPMGLRGSVGHRTRNEARGGRKETVTGFAREAWAANTALRLYEAATKNGEPDLDVILGYMSDRHDGPMGLPSTRALHGQTPDTARRWALGFVEEVVEIKLQHRVWPVPVRDYNPHGDYVGHRQGWAFNSLLGAAWLQMLWLMRGQSRRCEWCGKILDLGPEQEQGLSGTAEAPRSGEHRKRRKDRRFCNNDGRCRAKWNYHRGQGTSSKQRRKR